MEVGGLRRDKDPAMVKPQKAGVKFGVRWDSMKCRASPKTNLLPAGYTYWDEKAMPKAWKIHTAGPGVGRNGEAIPQV